MVGYIGGNGLLRCRWGLVWFGVLRPGGRYGGLVGGVEMRIKRGCSGRLWLGLRGEWEGGVVFVRFEKG